ncbi:hypothetical protein [Roseiconus lacunae]|uniref:hypothetical protein n=1 Tax=Roseiconus lacunae TaxID=2605694 RepID=UPI0011F3EAC3|nr:hypothetical protein [Roseiconus lacunae]WRQ53258.1 hypothetical protein U8335_12190 [Stieleria sp. HD01]
MIRDLVSSLDYSVCAEIALALFVGTFALVFFAAFRLSNSATDRFASIPLSDQPEDPRSE